MVVSYRLISCITLSTTFDGAVAKTWANGLVCSGIKSWYQLQPRHVFKSPIDKCKATTPSSLSLTTNKIYNLLSLPSDS